MVILLQVVLSEEVASSKLTLFDITKRICDAVQARAEKGNLFEFPCILRYPSCYAKNGILDPR